MPRVRLTLTLPTGAWARTVSSGDADTELRVLATLPGPDTGVGLLEIEASEPDRVVARVREQDAITSVTRLQSSETTLVEFETTRPLLATPARNAGVSIEPPVLVRDGRATLEVTAPQRRLATFGTRLAKRGIEFEVESVDEPAASALLTECQYDVVCTAHDCGYYDVPRTCTLTDLADELDLAKSTVSETLHRAEGKIVKSFSGEPTLASVTHD